ncbi:hypothetical protein GCM10010977_15110 [Citricoccus zhacaiensis]|uniref:DUF2127 domain-containing protein n=1 Tax=Citricoccus zhacaiensis TaxID=489142 RepID=A0ABQ2M0N9_9MICC|nr:hypothetical protein GCM10010977_15110 [Citricoccus zhacaiensis]
MLITARNGCRRLFRPAVTTVKGAAISPQSNRKPDAVPTPEHQANPRSSTPPERAHRAPSVVALTVLLLLQALAVLGVAVVFALEIGSGVLNLGAQIFLVVLVAAAGIWIGAAGLSLWAGRAWVRAAVVVIELFAVILSVSFFSAGNVATGLLFLVPAAGILFLMFSRQVAEHLAGLHR